MATDLTQVHWDVIVIGTGIGGGTIGRRLAEGGAKVLFLEKGAKGARAEENGLRDDVHLPVARMARGFWPKPLEVTLNGRSSQFYGPIGAGVGGSSVFYAATLERPERHDLEHSNLHPHPTQGWPISFDDFTPYLAQAEQAYCVNGTNDPLSKTPSEVLKSPRKLSPSEQSIYDALLDNGLNPYQAHLAVDHRFGSPDYLGRKCPDGRKKDGRSAGVEPALATGNATLLDQCDVTQIGTDPSGATFVQAHRGDQQMQFTAKTYVLAAGGLGSPRVLLRSASETHPQGVGNGADLVGRHLMFHLNEMFAVWPKVATNGPSKGIGLRDLYAEQGERFGMIQSMGVEAGYGEILMFLNLAFDQSRLAKAKSLRHLLRFPAAAAVKMFGSAAIFSAIMEDMPYAENRVTLHPDDPDIIQITYHTPTELLERRKRYHRKIRQAFKGMRPTFLMRRPEINYGHPMGSLRFGDDPRSSVLDVNCRVHGVQNLYVTDSSFMPTSFGVNPSLTIAANALRVGDHILSRLQNGEMT